MLLNWKIKIVAKKAKNRWQCRQNRRAFKQKQEAQAFITTKYHKEGSSHTLSFSLKNPSNLDIEKIGKLSLDTVNKNDSKETTMTQLKKTSQITNKFKNIKNKEKPSSLATFYVENFYPFISIDLFKDAANYAKAIANKNDRQLYIIIQSRKSMLFNNNELWVKRTGGENIDISMGCYDGAVVCELVGT